MVSYRRLLLCAALVLCTTGWLHKTGMVERRSGSPMVPMPSTAPVMGYLRACTTYSREIPLTIYIDLGELAQSLGAGPYDPNSMNVMRCLRTLVGENGKHLPRWGSLSLHAGARVSLDEDLLQVFYQDIPNLVFLHLQNFSDLAFPRFKSLPSLLQYSRAGQSGLHMILIQSTREIVEM
jgi:hypothetical protein